VGSNAQTFPDLPLPLSLSLSRCTLGQKIESTVQRLITINLACILSREGQRSALSISIAISIAEYRRVNVDSRENSGRFLAADASELAVNRASAANPASTMLFDLPGTARN